MRVCFRALNDQPDEYQLTHTSYAEAPSNKSSRLDEHWPEFQNERPVLAESYLSRCDVTPLKIIQHRESLDPPNKQQPRTVVVYGLPGVGKSQICLRAIMENQERSISNSFTFT